MAKTTERTSFTKDIEGRYLCNDIAEVNASDFAQRGARKTALQESVYFVNTTGERPASIELTETKWDIKSTTEV